MMNTRQMHYILIQKLIIPEKSKKTHIIYYYLSNHPDMNQLELKCNKVNTNGCY